MGLWRTLRAHPPLRGCSHGAAVTRGWPAASRLYPRDTAAPAPPLVTTQEVSGRCRVFSGATTKQQSGLVG